MPRIRSGANLDPAGVLTIHYTSQTDPLSCEAIMDTTQPAQFDNIGFYTYDSSTNLNLPVTIADISGRARNYSVPFTANNIIRQIQLYKCCTTYQGAFVRCQGTYVINDLLSTTAISITSNSPCFGTTTTSAGLPCGTTTTATTASPCSGIVFSI